MFVWFKTKKPNWTKSAHQGKDLLCLEDPESWIAATSATNEAERRDDALDGSSMVALSRPRS